MLLETLLVRHDLHHCEQPHCQTCQQLPESLTRLNLPVIKATILQSQAFRSLQYKTQILPLLKYDQYVTSRLAHSLDVAAVVKAIGATGYCPYIADLLEICGLLHDIGHPPFGHAGERVLDRLMADEGGFESNAQTYRILKQYDLSFLGLILVKHKQQIPPKRQASYQFYKGMYSEDWIEFQYSYETHQTVSPLLTDLGGLIDIIDELCYCITDIQDLIFARGYDCYHDYIQRLIGADNRQQSQHFIKIVIHQQHQPTQQIIQALIRNGLIDINPYTVQQPVLVNSLLAVNKAVLVDSVFYQAENQLAHTVIAKQYHQHRQQSQKMSHNKAPLVSIPRQIGDAIALMTEHEIMKTSTKDDIQCHNNL